MWTTGEKSRHINEKELTAATRSVVAGVPLFSGADRKMLVWLDNATAVAKRAK